MAGTRSERPAIAEGMQETEKLKVMNEYLNPLVSTTRQTCEMYQGVQEPPDPPPGEGFPQQAFSDPLVSCQIWSRT